jgi:nucleoside 2-deoxyribosyltransferase
MNLTLHYLKESFMSFFNFGPKRVYLAGTTSLYLYREECKRLVSNLDYLRPLLELVDPMDFEYDITHCKIQSEDDVEWLRSREFSDETIIRIVETDLNLIDSCKVLVAYIEKPTFGTIMEISYAKNIGKKVYVINPKGDLKNDVWLRYHTDKFFDNIPDCFNFICNIL